MKHLQSFDNFVTEGLSKINPGKRLIYSSLAGSPSASKYVKLAKDTLDAWMKLAEETAKARADKDKSTVKANAEKKKEILAKLLGIKKEALAKSGEEMKGIPSEKKAAAKEKSEEVSKVFTAAIKKKEQKAENIEGGESTEEEPKVDTEKIKAEMDKIKDEMTKSEEEFNQSQDDDRDAWEKMMDDKGFTSADWFGDNGWGEATDLYDDFQSEKSKKENDFYSNLQSLADKYSELEKQLDAAGGKNESYVWEAIDRILEFDAQGMADKAKERAEKTEDKHDAFKAKQSGEEDGDGDDSKKEEEKLQSMMKTYQKMSSSEHQSREGQELMGKIEDQIEKVSDAGGNTEWPTDDDDEDIDADWEAGVKKELEEAKDLLKEKKSERLDIIKDIDDLNTDIGRFKKEGDDEMVDQMRSSRDDKKEELADLEDEIEQIESDIERLTQELGESVSYNTNGRYVPTFESFESFLKTK
jgi:hypothetical protein